MPELYSIMRDLLEVEYDQKSLLCVLKRLEASYGDDPGETKWIINSIRYYVEVLQRELREAINRLDVYTAQGAEEHR